jgi:hypothetical protein
VSYDLERVVICALPRNGNLLHSLRSTVNSRVTANADSDDFVQKSACRTFQQNWATNLDRAIKCASKGWQLGPWW